MIPSLLVADESLGCRLLGFGDGWAEARAFGLWLWASICQQTHATVRSVGNERQDQILQRLADLWGSCNLNLVQVRATSRKGSCIGMGCSTVLYSRHAHIDAGIEAPFPTEWMLETH